MSASVTENEHHAPATLAVRPVVVAPTYNHCGSLLNVLARIEALSLPIIVVNDGSTDATAASLATWIATSRAIPVQVLTHPHNQGKAAALHTGFREAIGLGYTHAITIDTDGQHDPAEIPVLLQASQQQPTALVLGDRVAPSNSPKSAPLLSLLGRHTANLGIHCTTGLRLRDSQCGLRIYPLELIRTVPCRMGRYAFESEIITRAAWAGWPVVHVPVTSRYAPGSQRISHFRTIRDTTHGLLLQFLLLLRQLLPIKHKQTCPAPTLSASMPHTPRDQITLTAPAASVAVGLLLAFLPIYPLQPLAALYIAWRLRVHAILMVPFASLALPPIGGSLATLSLTVGHFLLLQSPPDLSTYDLHSFLGMLHLYRGPLLAWLIGSMAIGIPIMLIAFFALWAVLAKLTPATPEGA